MPQTIRAAALLCAVALAGCVALLRPHVEFEVDGDPVIRMVKPDRIRAIDEPESVTASAADRFLGDDDPVLGLVMEGEARAYPLDYLNTHEIVNDRLGDTPIAATW